MKCRPTLSDSELPRPVSVQRGTLASSRAAELMAPQATTTTSAVKVAAAALPVKPRVGRRRLPCPKGWSSPAAPRPGWGKSLGRSIIGRTQVMSASDLAWIRQGSRRRCRTGCRCCATGRPRCRFSPRGTGYGCSPWAATASWMILHPRLVGQRRERVRPDRRGSVGSVRLGRGRQTTVRPRRSRARTRHT